jgi:plasmid stabilization system protein ParE
MTVPAPGSPIWRLESGPNASASWHPDALNDVARLYDFLAATSPAAAQRSASVILDPADRIEATPHIGLARAEFREWSASFGRSAYILRYAILPTEEILIVRVWHNRELRTP